MSGAYGGLKAPAGVGSPTLRYGITFEHALLKRGMDFAAVSCSLLCLFSIICRKSLQVEG